MWLFGVASVFGSVSSMKRENSPKETCAASPLINKGLKLLQSVTDRASHATEKKPLRSHQSPRNSAQAISCYYRKAVRAGLGGVPVTTVCGHHGAGLSPLPCQSAMGAVNLWSLEMLGGKLPHRAWDTRGLGQRPEDL